MTLHHLEHHTRRNKSHGRNDSPMKMRYDLILWSRGNFYRRNTSKSRYEIEGWDRSWIKPRTASETSWKMIFGMSRPTQSQILTDKAWLAGKCSLYGKSTQTPIRRTLVSQPLVVRSGWYLVHPKPHDDRSVGIYSSLTFKVHGSQTERDNMDHFLTQPYKKMTLYESLCKNHQIKTLETCPGY